MLDFTFVFVTPLAPVPVSPLPPQLSACHYCSGCTLLVLMDIHNEIFIEDIRHWIFDTETLPSPHLDTH